MTTRYGLPQEPETREFGYARDGEVHTFVFHPRFDIGFNEVVEFAQLRQRHQDDVRSDGAALMEAFKKLAEERNLRVEDGVQITDLDDDEYKRRAEQIEVEFTEREHKRFLAKIELVLYLVHEPDRDRFREILATAHPVDVSALLDGLRGEVIARAAKQVEAVMGVDPSSPALPSA